MFAAKYMPSQCPLPHLLNGHARLDGADKVHLECDSEFVMFGRSTLTCVSGEWSPPISTTGCYSEFMSIIRFLL